MGLAPWRLFFACRLLASHTSFRLYKSAHTLGLSKIIKIILHTSVYYLINNSITIYVKTFIVRPFAALQKNNCLRIRSPPFPFDFNHQKNRMEERRMENWRKYVNYKRLSNADGTYVYVITIDGEYVEVSEAVYRDYAATSRKMKYMELDLKRDRNLKEANGRSVKGVDGEFIVLPEREVSLELVIEKDWVFLSLAQSAEDSFVTKEESEKHELYRCIALLTDDERELINAIFFKGMTEKAYADKIGVKQQSINE
jgi:hypothetical protein